MALVSIPDLAVLPVDLAAVGVLVMVALCWQRFVFTALAVAGVALSIYGQYQQQKSEKRAAKGNKAIAEAQAQDAIARGKERETDARQVGREVIGAQRAGFAGQGVVVDDGSPLEVQLDTIAQAERDALTERNNAMREAWGYQKQKDQFGAQAKQITRSGNIRMGTTLVTGGAQAYDTYQRSR